MSYFLLALCFKTHWLLVKGMKIYVLNTISWNRIFHFKEDRETKGFKNRVLPEQILHLGDLKQFSNIGIKVTLSHFIKFQFVRKTIMKSHVASLVVFGCVSLFMNLFRCSWRNFCLFVSSLLASSQLEEINKDMFNKILKKCITICLSHPIVWFTQQEHMIRH